MLAKKISILRVVILFTALAVVISGCTPTGPRALLEGKKRLDAGDYAGAYAQLSLAAAMLRTNAAAWNYLGVAAQGSGQPVEAANDYLKALELDRDLVEAHYNLGCLYLEQNQLDSAKSELTSYILRRPNDVEGWHKLGSAQLRLGETVAAQRSFSAVLYLKPKEKDAEAYNGLGLAYIQQNQPHTAIQYFNAALQVQPDYAPALLNLAATEQEYLRDNRTALDDYRKYLMLLPHPANWDEVSAIADNLERSMPAPPAPPAPATPVATQTPPVLTTTSTPPPHLAAATMPTTSARTPVQASVVSRSSVSPSSTPATTHRQQPVNVSMQTVRVAPEPTIVTTPTARPSSTASAGSSDEPVVAPPLVEGDTTKAATTSKGSFWDHLKPTKWFGSDHVEVDGDSEYDKSKVTPLTPSANPPVIRPFVPITRYQYLYPAPPVPGERRPASGAFTKAQLYEQDQDWTDAMLWYAQAAAFDPSWYEAHYNEGVAAQRIRNYSRALSSYELALAIEPDSVDARYNFALALKAAGHPVDAVNELQKIVVGHPAEARAYLALGNLYAQNLNEPGRARPDYLKVLELDPRNPQVPMIRSWLNGK